MGQPGPGRLVYTMAWEPPMSYISPGETVTVEFRPRGEGIGTLVEIAVISVVAPPIVWLIKLVLY